MTPVFSSVILILMIILFETLNNWFKRNLLSLNLKKNIHFVTKNTSSTILEISEGNKTIPNVTYIKFLGLIIDNTLKWGSYIEHLINRLSSLCYVVRQIKSYMYQTLLITIYNSSFQSIVSYGITFWGNSIHSSKIFKIPKRATGIIMRKRSRDSCRNLFKELKIRGMFKKRPNFLNSAP
jgi:hypothetical protein